GQCDVPEGNDFVSISAISYHTLAQRSDGNVASWGRNIDGECNIPEGYDFIGLAAGTYHSLALYSLPISGYIDWTDLIAFCERWLDEGCSDVNDWCGRADINRDTEVDFSDYSWLTKYFSSIAPEPNSAGNPEPHDTATEVSITADLSWAAGADTAAHGVYFGTNPKPDANEFQGYQTETIFNPGTMAADTTYYWQVDEVGLGGKTTGDVWSFTTAPVPGKAYNPSPSNLATDININHNLSWTANFYTTSHDVYFGTNPTPGAGEFEGNQTSTTFEPGTLDYETTYYWRIDGVGPGGITTGIVWNFTTEALPVPGQAGNPVPANMATDVNITTCLSWTAGVNTQSHDVYFGTSSPGDFQGNQTETTFCPPSSLEYNTTYYWRIDEKNPYNTTPGEVWSFTTMVDPNLVGWWKFDETSGVIAYDSSGKENHGMLTDGLGNGLVWAPGEGALNFDGSNNLSRVVVSTVGMSTTEGSIGIWARLAEPQNRGDGRNGSGYFFGCDNGVKDKILLYMDNSNTQLDVRIGDHSENNIITLGTLVWYHIALTWNRGSYVVYLNGSVMAAGAYDGLTSLPSTADIGNNGGSSKQSIHGLMGDVQVYDKSISTPDIHQHYQDVAN
ncbi:MAG: LamG-like jellyroll fold domain-containing protein, partial [Planctomycetota bacterium]